MTRSVPVRQCIDCRRRRPKTALLRLARGDREETILLTRGTDYHPGRGEYLCEECLRRARSRGLPRRKPALRAETIERIASELERRADSARIREAHAARLLGLLGLARRANRLRVGKDESIGAIHRGDAALVVLAEDAGENLRGAVEITLRGIQGLAMVRGPKKDEIGRALGRRPVAVLVVTDAGLARAIQLRLESSGSEVRGSPQESEFS